MIVRLAVILGMAAAAAGCSSGLTASAPVPEAPERPAQLSPPASPAAPSPVIPEHLLEEGATFTLADVVDIALRNNPVTRTAWLEALSAAAELGSARSAYYPRVDLTIDATRTQQSALGGQFDFLQTSYGPTVDLSWLVLDLGGRAADAEDARLGLLAADWTHNAVDPERDPRRAADLRPVPQLEGPARGRPDQRRPGPDRPRRRRRRGTTPGVATIAEVLQAKTALSQEQLAVDRLSGQVLALRGSLATAMGLPGLHAVRRRRRSPPSCRSSSPTATVEQLIDEARAAPARPRGGAARGRAGGRPHPLGPVRRACRCCRCGASASRIYYDPADLRRLRRQLVGAAAARRSRCSPDSRPTLRHPRRRRQDAAASAVPSADTLEQQVILEVWTSYYGLKTATQLVSTTRDLLASAEQSERVAMGRYHEGVGTILDLLAAQSALADARAEEILARSSWFYALAQLAHDIGIASPTLQATVAVIEQKESP